MPLVLDPISLLLYLLRCAGAFLISLGMHLGLLLPFILAGFLVLPTDLAGEEDGDDGPIGEGGTATVVTDEPPVEVAPVRVTLYEETIVKPTQATPAPTPNPVRQSDPAEAGPGEEAPEVTGDPTGGEPIPARKPMGKQPRGSKKPCDLIEEIVKTGEGRWQVERAVIDYYATHLKELYRQGGVWPHTAANGTIDGMRLSLPRCSVVRQVGLRTGDVVHTINGRKVETLAQALATYFSLRNESVIEVRFARKGESKLFIYTLVK